MYKRQLCAGVIFYTGNGGTGLTVADITDTMPETGTDEIVAGEEEVPLALSLIHIWLYFVSRAG